MRPALLRCRGCRGAVLIEIIMTTLIGALLLAVLPGFYLGYIKLWRQETSRLGAGDKATVVVRRIKTDVRNALSATVSSDGNGLSLVLPELSYDPEHHVMGAAVGEDGSLVHGQRVEYYFAAAAGSTGGSIYRRVTGADGAQLTQRVVTDSVYPQLNPLSSETGNPAPLFYWNMERRTVVITVTASEPRPSSSTFCSTSMEPICARDAAPLVRVATQDHPEGEVQCSECGRQVKPASELVTYRTELMLRNG